MRARTSPSFTTELKSTFISVMVPEIWEPTWTCRIGAMPPLALTLCTMLVRTDASVLNSTGAGFLKRSQPVTSTVTSSRTAGRSIAGNELQGLRPDKPRPDKPEQGQWAKRRENGFMGKQERANRRNSIVARCRQRLSQHATGYANLQTNTGGQSKTLNSPVLESNKRSKRSAQSDLTLKLRNATGSL